MKRVIRTRGQQMKVRTPRIIHHHDRSEYWAGLLLLVLLAVGLWLAYEYGLEQGGYQRDQASQQLRVLQQELKDQQELLAGLRAESVRYKRQAEIERQASRKLQQDMMGLQDQIAALQSETELLQSLIAEGSGPLYIRNVVLEPMQEAGSYRFHLTLVQVSEKIRRTQGKLLLKLIGRQKGKKRQLDASQFVVDGEKARKLEFSNYIDVNGEIRLPDGFKPQKLSVEFLPRTKGLDRMVKDFEWSALVEGKSG